MITVPSKCILSGEHTVLAGGDALVIPLHTFNLGIEYVEGHEFTVFFNGELVSKDFLSILQSITEIKEHLSGQLHITSTIPQGSGLGSSAALCVGLSRLLQERGIVEENDIFEWARNCENLFHGKSSGVDIAGVMAGGLVLFNMETGITPIKPTWQPYVYLSYCGSSSNTKLAVDTVNQYRSSSKKR